MTVGTWLVTGGAGYIGAHVVAALRSAAVPVLAVDDLSTGRRERLGDVPLLVGCVLDDGALAAFMGDHRVVGVIHTAARKDVVASHADPAGFHRTNVEGLRRVLAAMHAAGVNRLVFASSAAVYGASWYGPLTESMTCTPQSPYGRTKQIGEALLAAHARDRGLRYVALRYFNVAGAADPSLRDISGTSLLGAVRARLHAGRPPVIYGADHPTPDGTCVRDYVHVEDVAAAHLAVLPLLDSTCCDATFNLGTGQGHSVRQVLAEVVRVTTATITPTVLGRRDGDVASSVASITAIQQVTGWSPQRTLTDIVASEFAGA